MNLSTLGAATAVVMASLVAASAPATAETTSVTDERYDSPSSVDIRKVTFVLDKDQLVVKAKMVRRLGSVQVQANMDPGRLDAGGEFFLGGSRSGRRKMHVSLSYAPVQGAGGSEVRCTAARGAYLPASRTVRLVVPMNCVTRQESPGRRMWLGAVAYGGPGLDSAPGDADNRPAYIQVTRG